MKLRTRDCSIAILVGAIEGQAHGFSGDRAGFGVLDSEVAFASDIDLAENLLGAARGYKLRLANRAFVVAIHPIKRLLDHHPAELVSSDSPIPIPVGLVEKLVESGWRRGPFGILGTRGQSKNTGTDGGKMEKFHTSPIPNTPQDLVNTETDDHRNAYGKTHTPEFFARPLRLRDFSLPYAMSYGIFPTFQN